MGEPQLSPPSLPGTRLVSHPLTVGNSQVNKGVWCDLKVWRIPGVCYLSLVITDFQIGSYATRPKKRGTGPQSYG